MCKNTLHDVSLDWWRCWPGLAVALQGCYGYNTHICIPLHSAITTSSDWKAKRHTVAGKWDYVTGYIGVLYEQIEPYPQAVDQLWSLFIGFYVL